MDPEIIDITDLDDIPVISLNDDNNNKKKSSSFNSRPSVNFGGGIELLMNDKRTKSKDNGMDDIDDMDDMYDMDDLG